MTETTYDYILRGGLVVDGTGEPGRRADVAITRHRIAALGEIPPAQAAPWTRPRWWSPPVSLICTRTPT